MSGGLSGHGGQGGVTARYDDLLAAAGLMGRQADTLRDTGADAAAVALDAAVLEAGLLCPAEVLAVEGSAAAAGVTPGSATWLGVELEGFAAVVQVSVAAYREVDEAMADLDDAVHQGLGWLTGAALGSNPLTLLLLAGAGYLGRDELLELLHDDPELLESLLESAPGLVQGLALTLLGPAALVGSDGLWPTTDYEEAVLGLQAFAQKLGLLHDTGTFPFEVSESKPGSDLSTVAGMAGLEWEQAYHQRPDGTYVPRIVVSPVTHDGVTSYVVHIPGTEVWSPQRGSNPYDLTSNLTLMSQQQQAAVAAAVTQVVQDLDGPVMLVGHSQGGIIAAAVASDPALEGQVQGMFTMGSPIATFPIPPHVQVLSIENSHDAVPMLDGADNPDLPHWTTITHDDSSTDLVGAHSGSQYVEAAHQVDTGGLMGSLQDSLDAWQQDNAQFFGTSDETIIYELPDAEEAP